MKSLKDVYEKYPYLYEFTTKQIVGLLLSTKTEGDDKLLACQIILKNTKVPTEDMELINETGTV